VAEHFDGGVPGGDRGDPEGGCPPSGAVEAVEYPLFSHDAYLFGVLWERQRREIMAPDPAAAAAETPCPECGSKRATTTPGEELAFECRDCGAAFDLPRVG